MKDSGRFNLVTGSIILLAILLLGHPPGAHAFDSGSTGALGAFSPSVNTTLTIPDDGIFNFTTIDIPVGVMLLFTPNPINTPVYLLATGDVNILGIILVNGASVAQNTRPGGIGVAGGASGGTAAITETDLGGPGHGPGGGMVCPPDRSGGGGGAYVNYGQVRGSSCTGYPDSGRPYGNSIISPMLGGSGGGGGRMPGNSAGGGGGGGAILVASSGTITISGSILSNGGNGGQATQGGGGGGGSGGSIFLKADVIAGEGIIQAIGGLGGNGGSLSHSYGGYGSDGRVRLESNTKLRQAIADPVETLGPPTSVFVVNMPTVTMTAINGTSVTLPSGGSIDYPNIVLGQSTSNPLTMDIAATDVPVGTTVEVLMTPKIGEQSVTTSTALSGTLASSTATASIALPTDTDYFVFSLSVSFDAGQASLGFPKYVEGEKIERIVVSSEIGSASKVFYITESGRKVPARM